jgi:hypothetical protein
MFQMTRSEKRLFSDFSGSSRSATPTMTRELPHVARSDSALLQRMNAQHCVIELSQGIAAMR